MQFGIIGCGTIAQIMHIPYVVELPEADLHALADPAVDRANRLAERYNVDNVFASAEDMIAALGDELDAAIVLTPPNQHVDVVERTLEADIHTLVEKPLSVSIEDADRMVAAAETSDATAMVAYMKRYDPAYQDAQDEIANLDAIDTVTAYDVDPDHGRIIDEVYDLVTGDVPDDVIAESMEKQRADSMAAVATEDEDRADDYHWHLEHICHDVNVLRGIFGDVERIDHVDLYADGRYATAHLVYEGGVRCTLESGLSERKWFEEWLRVDTAEGMVRLEWSNPFIKNSPTELQVKRGVESIADETRTPSYDEPFKAEIEHFIGAVQGGREVLTPFTEARDDVRLIADLFRCVDSKSLIGDY